MEDPVPPMMPTVCPEAIERSMSLSTFLSAFAAYAKLTCSKRMEPSLTVISAPVGLAISVFSSSTSAMRRAEAREMVIMVKTMESIINAIKICVA